MRLVLWSLISIVLTAGVAFADDNVSSAREHYRRGATLYDLRRYKEAAKEYEKAYEAKDDPALLFNIGQAYRLANEPTEAIASYRAFLRRLPEASNKIEVEVFIEELQKQLDQQKRAQEAKPVETQPPQAPLNTRLGQLPPADAPPPVDTGRTKRMAGIAVGAVGVALLAAGAAFGALAQQTSNRFSHPAEPGKDRFDPDIDARGRTYFAAEIGTLVAGGVAVITGAALFAVGQKERPRVTLLPTIAPDRAALTLDMRF